MVPLNLERQVSDFEPPSLSMLLLAKLPSMTLILERPSFKRVILKGAFEIVSSTLPKPQHFWSCIGPSLPSQFCYLLRILNHRPIAPTFLTPRRQIAMADRQYSATRIDISRAYFGAKKYWMTLRITELFCHFWDPVKFRDKGSYCIFWANFKD